MLTWHDYPNKNGSVGKVDPGLSVGPHFCPVQKLVFPRSCPLDVCVNLEFHLPFFVSCEPLKEAEWAVRDKFRGIPLSPFMSFLRFLLEILVPYFPEGLKSGARALEGKGAIVILCIGGTLDYVATRGLWRHFPFGEMRETRTFIFMPWLWAFHSQIPKLYSLAGADLSWSS